MNLKLQQLSRIYKTIGFLLLWLASANAQDTLQIATNYKSAYHKHSRSKTDSPGVNYWQNTADYHIDVQFSPTDNKLSGMVQIQYVNNSPDTLHQIIFKLYPNLYQAQAMRNFAPAADDLTKGVEIQSVQIDNHLADKKSIRISGTNMVLKGVTVQPKQKINFDIAYNYQVNKGSFNRTGQVDSGSYMIAYFFPRIAVYDDIDGWNTYPYIGKEEFYNDYCNFDLNITVPGQYAVWGTGDLMNPEAVYQPELVQRLDKANHSDSVIAVIQQEDLAKERVTLPGQTHIWHFKAGMVTDFAFAISNHDVWKATSVMVDPVSKRRTRVDAVYNPQHHNFDPVVNYARKTVELISYELPAVPFPYPHETIFEGLDATEYPMMVNNQPFEGNDAVEFTTHEVFHSLFPFYVGSNETKYSFMDEGLATFTEFTFGPLIAPGSNVTYDLGPINETAGSDQDVPIMTLTPQLYGAARFSNKDLKPALGFHYLKEMLGDKLFNKALQYYISQWAGKHPSPYDFFNCFNKGAGRNLNWFWQNWFFEKNVPDLAITKVAKGNITVSRIGLGMVPVHLKIYFKDGTEKKVARKIDCWSKGNRTLIIPLRSTKPVLRMILGDDYDADVDKNNNIWHSEKT